jgi:thioredoxin-dependent peroxiredoxin
MTDAQFCQRQLDIPLRLADGGTTNLGHFCGQKLIVFFYPADAPAAAQEIEAYEALLPQIERSGAWLVGVMEYPGDANRAPGAASPISLGLDPDGSAFLALARTMPEQDFDAREGAAFLIDRDGVVRHAWQGVGHVREALDVATQRP